MERERENVLTRSEPALLGKKASLSIDGAQRTRAVLVASDRDAFSCCPRRCKERPATEVVALASR